jgi:hypothetical protein
VDILLSLEKNLQAVESDLMIMKNTDMGIIESQCRYDDGMYFFFQGIFEVTHSLDVKGKII